MFVRKFDTTSDRVNSTYRNDADLDSGLKCVGMNGARWHDRIAGRELRGRQFPGHGAFQTHGANLLRLFYKTQREVSILGWRS